MPVRSSTSSVLKWPDAEAVCRALCRWAEEVLQKRNDVLKIGYFGSYARGDWGVGSDIDVLIVVRTCDQPLERRGKAWDLGGLPVPADTLIYTEKEWHFMAKERKALARDIVWVCSRK